MPKMNLDVFFVPLFIDFNMFNIEIIKLKIPTSGSGIQEKKS